jgi:hypothetical protein
MTHFLLDQWYQPAEHCKELWSLHYAQKAACTRHCSIVYERIQARARRRVDKGESIRDTLRAAPSLVLVQQSMSWET